MQPGYQPLHLLRRELQAAFPVQLPPLQPFFLQGRRKIAQGGMEKTPDVRQLQPVDLPLPQPQAVGNKMGEGAGAKLLQPRDTGPELLSVKLAARFKRQRLFPVIVKEPSQQVPGQPAPGLFPGIPVINVPPQWVNFLLLLPAAQLHGQVGKGPPGMSYVLQQFLRLYFGINPGAAAFPCPCSALLSRFRCQQLLPQGRKQLLQMGDKQRGNKGPAFLIGQGIAYPQPPGGTGQGHVEEKLLVQQAPPAARGYLQPPAADDIPFFLRQKTVISGTGRQHTVIGPQDKHKTGLPRPAPLHIADKNLIQRRRHKAQAQCLQARLHNAGIKRRRDLLFPHELHKLVHQLQYPLINLQVFTRLFRIALFQGFPAPELQALRCADLR